MKTYLTLIIDILAIFSASYMTAAMSPSIPSATATNKKTTTSFYSDSATVTRRKAASFPGVALYDGPFVFPLG
jgi:hypothetical protein